jgi:hypothetical protein
MKTIKIFIIGFGIFFASMASAHQPVLEPQDSPDFKNQGMYLGAVPLEDPTIASLSVYGSLSSADEYDLYVFVPAEDAVIPVELLVPIRSRNMDFKPSFVILSKDITESDDVELPFDLIDGYKTKEFFSDNRSGNFFEPYSMERYFRGTEIQLAVTKGQNYFIAVREPNKQSGDYVLAIGTKENFENASWGKILKDVASIKAGLLNNLTIPWKDILGLFLLLSGTIIGLGAVTVIDIHGFLGRHSAYWTAAAIRTHKVTKPLIWLGFALIIAGGAVFYRQSWLNGVVLFQAVLMAVLMINGLFLTFYISPRLNALEAQGKSEEPLPLRMRNVIAVSFMFSFVGWWTYVFFLVWYLIMQS